jgi:hypothetical protein
MVNLADRLLCASAAPAVTVTVAIRDECVISLADCTYEKSA